MGTQALRGHLVECQRAWDGAGTIARMQAGAFMEPMLNLLHGVVVALEIAEHERAQTMMALSMAGIKGGAHGERP